MPAPQKDVAAAFAQWRKDRSLALNRVAVKKLRREPALMEDAWATLRRWRGTVSAHSQPYLVEWEAIMAQGLDATVTVLLEDSEHAADLRKCGPFSCLLTDEERMSILRAWAPRRPGKVR
jgi:hypothetical protein